MNIANADVEHDLAVGCLKSYLICSAPRTGSTLISSMLMDTGLAGQPFEFIHELSVREFFARVGRPLQIDEYANFLKERRCSRNGVFGIKAQYEQLLWMTHDVEFHKKFIGCFDRFVVIYRKDVLAQAISHYRAALTGVWHEAAELNISADAGGAGEYDPSEIAKYIAQNIWQPEAWRRLLRMCGAEWIEIAYEDLVQDPILALIRVMKYIGIDVDALPNPPGPRLRRQSDGISREWEGRFIKEILGVPGAPPRRPQESAAQVRH